LFADENFNTVNCNIATSSDRTFRNNNIQLFETLYLQLQTSMSMPLTNAGAGKKDWH